MDSTISFIIPHKGREELLLQTVESIINQDYPSKQIEIIIISQNDKLELLTDLVKKTNLIIIYAEKNLTISALRNLGSKQAKGEYLAFLDADIELASNWTSVLITTLLTDKSRVLVSAMQINSKNAPPLEQIRTSLSNAKLDCNLSFLPGRNLLLSKSAFEQVGGFPEHLVTCEDYYFTNMLSKHGKLFYSSATTYIHLGEDKEYLGMFKKEIWRGQSNLMSIQGRTVPLREIPSFVIPMVMLLLLPLALISLIANELTLVLICLFLLLLPITFYSFRLMLLSKRSIKIKYIIGFYLLYFPARALGSLLGFGYWISSLRKSSNEKA